MLIRALSDIQESNNAATRYLQLLDYQDSPTTELMASTNQEVKSSMSLELEQLLKTVPDQCKNEKRKELADFMKLFEKFINEPGPSINWGKIEKLPEDSVRETVTHAPTVRFPHAI